LRRVPRYSPGMRCSTRDQKERTAFYEIQQAPVSHRPDAGSTFGRCSGANPIPANGSKLVTATICFGAPQRNGRGSSIRGGATEATGPRTAEAPGRARNIAFQSRARKRGGLVRNARSSQPSIAGLGLVLFPGSTIGRCRPRPAGRKLRRKDPEPRETD